MLITFPPNRYSGAICALSLFSLDTCISRLLPCQQEFIQLDRPELAASKRRIGPELASMQRPDARNLKPENLGRMCRFANIVKRESEK
jgi:hypothetical protein